MSKKTSKKSPKSPSRPASGAVSKRPVKTKAAAKETAKSTGRKPLAAATRATATPSTGAAPSLQEGDIAPQFVLPRDGGGFVSLANYAGRRLVIFFYPRADTPGCTLEAAAFSRLAGAFADNNTAVLGVSADPVKAQNAFRDKHALSVPLASDENLSMLKAYGVWGEKSMYGKTFMGITRTTFLVDEAGRIMRIWRNLKVDGHAEDVLAAARG
jgi:peroxiredoxin Q/BCP